MKRKKKISFIILFAFGLIAFTGVGFWLFRCNKQQEPTNKQPILTTSEKKDIQINVFIHGTFGSILSFLSPYNVYNDTVRGSMYHKVTKQMRKHPFFFRDQPILHRGLVSIEPSFNPEVSNDQKCAVYPLIKAYDVIRHQINGSDNEPKYYTFGWTGLLSQTARRSESVRLYNALSKEVAALRKLGYKPKIRIIGHSHAGNLMLNLDMVNVALKYDLEQSAPENIFENKHRNEALSLMHKYLSALPHKKIALQKQGQKRWDYIPEYTNLMINELIMFGTPVQPETDHCALSQTTFNKVYHFYSQQDCVQRMDWASTKHNVSEQRFNLKKLTPDKQSVANLVQACITMGNCKIDSRESVAPQGSFWQRLFSGGAKTSDDPSHKELWFFNWNDEKQHFLAPLPAMILTPLFIEALNKNASETDVDLVLTTNNEQLKITVQEYNWKKNLSITTIPIQLLTTLKKQVASFKPQGNEHEIEFALINKYSTKS